MNDESDDVHMRCKKLITLACDVTRNDIAHLQKKNNLARYLSLICCRSNKFQIHYVYISKRNKNDM